MMKRLMEKAIGILLVVSMVLSFCTFTTVFAATVNMPVEVNFDSLGTISPFGNYITYNNGTGAVVSGLAGKASDDYSYTIVPEKHNENANYMPALNIEGITGLDFGTHEYLTYEANVYCENLTDGAEIFLRTSTGSNVDTSFKLNSNGKISCSASNSISYTAGKWHKLAIEVKLNSDGEETITYYLNGESIGTASKELGTKLIRFALRSTYASGDYTDGKPHTTAYDDVRLNWGAYNASADKITFLSNENVRLENTDIVYNGYAIKDVDSLGSAIKTATSAVSTTALKADLTLATSLEDAKIVAANSTGGAVHYYNVTADYTPAGALGLTSSSNYVRVMDESILVMSHYDDKRYFIHSDASTAADNTESGDVSFGLFSVLTSSNGYTLSYVDANKNVPEEVVKSVKDGYVLCQKDGEADVYIPIVHHGNEIKYAEHSYGYVAGAGAEKSTVGSLAGKSASDTANVISIGETAVSGGAFPRFQLPLSSITKDGTDTTCDEPISLETNIYADGDAILQISVRTYTVLQWRANGEVWGYKTTESTADFNGKATKIGELERGKWHRLTVGYDLNRNRVMIFADGVRLTNLGSRALSQTEQLNDTLRIGLADGSVNGKIAVDDCVGYKGYYYTSDDTVTFTGTENMKLENSVLTVNKDAYADIQSLIEAIKSAFGTTYASLLKSDLTAASSFDEAKTLVVTSSTGRVYKYYNLNLTDAECYNLVVEETFSADTPEDANISDDIKVQFYTFATNPVQSYHGAAMAGIGTKADDDYAYVITSSNETITSGYNTPQIDLNRTVNATERYLTLEFDIYKETMNVNASAFVVTDTGARINVADFLGNTEVSVGGLTRIMDHEVKRWYKVACVIDTEEDTWSIYINGKLMEVLSKENTTKNLAVESITRFAVHAYYPPELTAEEIAAAKTAIDNYKIYTTAYNPADDIVDISVKAPYVLDNVNSLIIADSLNGIKKSDVATIINTNGLDYKVFADATYRTELADADAITNESVIVVYSAGGESYGYYRFSTAFVDDPYLSVLAGEKEIMAVGFTNDVSCDYDLIIAEYDDDILENVNFVTIKPYERNINIIPYTKGYTYKAFVWESDTVNPASLNPATYSTQE